jgi:hypothetical protein
MFGSRVKHGVFGNTDGTRAIKHERYMGTLLAKDTQRVCVGVFDRQPTKGNTRGR